jgi:hypothetical protein
MLELRDETELSSGDRKEGPQLMKQLFIGCIFLRLFQLNWERSASRWSQQPGPGGRNRPVSIRALREDGLSLPAVKQELSPCFSVFPWKLC